MFLIGTVILKINSYKMIYLLLISKTMVPNFYTLKLAFILLYGTDSTSSTYSYIANKILLK